MKIFRNLGDSPPPVDLSRLRANLERVADLDRQLDDTLAELNRDLPADANAVAAAGIAFRAQVNRSASMIELGVAAVDALHRAGWTLTAPVTRAAATLAAQEERSVAETPAPARTDIPDDWAG